MVSFFKNLLSNSVLSYALITLISFKFPCLDIYLGSICSDLAAQPILKHKRGVDLGGGSSRMYLSSALVLSFLIRKATMASVVGNWAMRDTGS